MDQPHQHTNMPLKIHLKKNPSLVPPSPFSHHPCLTPFTRTSQTQNNFLDSLTPIHLLWIRLCSQILMKTTLVKVTSDLCVAKSNADCGPHLVWPIRSIWQVEHSCVSLSWLSGQHTLLSPSHLCGHPLSLFGSSSSPYSECQDVLDAVCELLLHSIYSSKHGDLIQPQGPQYHLHADADSKMYVSIQNLSLNSKLVYLITLQTSIQNKWLFLDSEQRWPPSPRNREALGKNMRPLSRDPRKHNLRLRTAFGFSKISKFKMQWRQ